jgi:hypothetical protein
MDRAKVEDLLLQMACAGSGWLGDAQRDVSARALKSETGQDFGADLSAWKSWWATVLSATSPDKEIPPLSAPRAKALALLKRMGLVDEDQFYESIKIDWEHSFRDFDRGIQSYLSNRPGPHVWVASRADSFCDSEYEADALAADIKGLFGIHASFQAVRADGVRAVQAEIGSERFTVTDRPRASVYSALLRAARGLDSKKSVYIENDRVRFLSEDNVAAIREHAVFPFRRINHDEPGAPHPDVRAAFDRLRVLGADLKLDDDLLAWGVDEARAECPGYAAQIIDLSDCGILIAPDERGSAIRNLTGRLAFMLEVDLIAPKGCRTILSLVGAINEQLDRTGSCWHLLGVPVQRQGSSFIRLIRVPVDRAPDFADLLQSIGGAVHRSTTPVGPDRFSLGATPTIGRVAPNAPNIVFDAECVDNASDYESLVADILAMTKGEVLVESIECTEHENTRTLRMRWGKRAFVTELEGGTDWVDLEPLLECLNKVAAAQGAKRRFVAFREVDWGQEAGVSFLDRSERHALSRSGHV